MGGQLRRRSGRGLTCVGQHHFLTPLPAFGGDDTAGDGEDPAALVFDGVAAVGRARDAEEDLLGEVLREVPRSGHAREVSKDPAVTDER